MALIKKKKKAARPSPEAPKVSPAPQAAAAPPHKKPTATEKRAEAAKAREAEAGKVTQGRGRPPALVPGDWERIEQLAAGGMTKLEIARGMGVDYTTLRDYEKKFPHFAQAIKRGKTKNITRAVASLHRCAHGYIVPEERLQFDALTGTWVREVSMKHYPPDVKALAMILQHEESGSWRPRTDMKLSGNLNQHHTGQVAHTIDTKNLEDILNGGNPP